MNTHLQRTTGDIRKLADSAKGGLFKRKIIQH